MYLHCVHTVRNKNCYYSTSVGGATRHTVNVRVGLCVCMSALVLKDSKESAGGKCNIDITR